MARVRCRAGCRCHLIWQGGRLWFRRDRAV